VAVPLAEGPQMTARRKIPETQLAAAVVAHFRSIPGATVYQEVEYGGPRADIVARVGRVLHVVECKVSFGVDVLEQAARWRTDAHLVSIATPFRDHYQDPQPFRRGLVESLGLGWLGVSVSEGWLDVPDEWKTREVVRPAFRRRVDPRLAETLAPEHETFVAAGTASGTYWSPWRATCKALAKYVAEHPGCTVKAAVAGIAHHYARDTTARSALAHWVHAGKVAGVERRDGAEGLWPTTSREGAA
jgi:hypothetical protein